MFRPTLQPFFPKERGMSVETRRKAELIDATIEEIGAVGSLTVSVGQIAKRAGVSSALAFHYFGDKDRLFLAAMRHVLSIYGAEVRETLRAAKGPRARLEAVIRASFSPTSFRREIIAAWLNFYVLAQRSPQARRLQSNLAYDLRPLVGDRAAGIAQRLGGLIDGLYMRHALDSSAETGQLAAAQVLAALETEIGTAARVPDAAAPI